MSEAVSKARSAAMYVLSRCRRFDAWSQDTISAAAKKFALDSRDSALCTRLCYAVLQNAALCDFYIDRYSSVPTEKMEPKVRDILRLGTVQLLFMDRIPVSAAVNESVALSKTGGGKASGLVNAVLRRIAENRAHLPEIPCPGTAEELSVRYSHPLWLCRKMTEEHGYEFARAYFETNNREPETDITVNLLRTDRDTLLRKLTDAGTECEAVDLSPLSIRLKKAGDVTALPGFAEGEFFVQDAAAAYAVSGAGVSSGMRVLDACAAPGGKSFFCASLMRNEGEILSCDIHAPKLSRIEDSAERMGFSLIRTAPMDASAPYERLWDSFDVVLADVPCSGLGVIRKKPEIRYKSHEELKRLPEVQLRILEGISRCVKPGGALLYSTCTILREENEDVTERFLSGHPDFTKETMETIYPQDRGTDGFFMCRMRRNG